MFEVVENVHFSARGLRRYYLVGLGHQSCFIYLALVVDLHFDLDSIFLLLAWLAYRAERLGYTALRRGIVQTRVEFTCVLRGLERNFHFNYLDVVLFVVRRMRSYQQSLMREITAVRSENA